MYVLEVTSDLSLAGTSLTIVEGAKKQNFVGGGGHPAHGESWDRIEMQLNPRELGE